MGIISVVIGGHFGGGDHFDGGDHFGGGTAIYCLPTRIIALLDMTKKRHWRFTGLYSIVHHNASPIKSRACRYWVDLTRCQGLWKLMVFNLSVIDHHENARSLSSCHRLLSGQKKCTQNERNHVYWRLQYWHTVGKIRPCQDHVTTLQIFVINFAWPIQSLITHETVTVSSKTLLDIILVSHPDRFAASGT